MTPLLAATLFGAVSTAFAVGCLAWRLIRGPSTADRAIALDMLGLAAIAVAALTAIAVSHQAFLDVAFGIALISFLAAVAFAGLLERGSSSAETERKRP